MGAVNTAYGAAKTAVAALKTAAVNAQDPDNNTALESVALAGAATAADAALAALKSVDNDERVGNQLSTLSL
jgi:hypothetical protein